MEIDLKKLDTEQVNENTKSIDSLSTIDMITTINNEDKKVALAVENVIPNIASVVDETYDRLKRGGRLIYIGAGTSGRLGVLDASECPPTYGVDFELVKGIMAGGKDAMFKAKEGAEDSKELAVEDLKDINLTEKDMVIGLAASGRTPYVIGGLEYAKKIKAGTGSISCVNNSEISKIADFPVEVIVGPEVVTGSTRMKSGTAQKMVLNMISTGVMIKLGKVYGNLMIDVKATNEKLVERAKGIIMKCTGCTREVAEEYMNITGDDVRLSIFMILSDLDKEQSIEFLSKNDNNIRKALESINT
ncbi:N-acetylmuramic acid 6-phosphate etherase [Clostridium celatum]|uniref:N-acetylmuramic acid 6-phosphate etherase n=1 Tax=Clostridium celatum DSM 1785 TaxID=545697 RepID=L1QLL1_9CLOT|nr:N-acetylmuramic acid 6-phosphate etherase [Clostridium celatum]EKY28620.1 N-acetylmuramic acid 6-phosphate etherase [Clostridium celatum DSM 1785]MCE9654914.1 N-acetylmuramic acid 6-phosphate etherase [Clostridium celatum]MDU2265346.1 N-acetylmuramic acid 6-phosphate etherase [Clostridium celatum]MDU3723844.1 N-acetylmuramic acid 6-phosphate etherase [Clostridium celatum]MDU6294978.1 N-acetylmuramic acid 6-phosphate etherase [Clostridium celatum]